MHVKNSGFFVRLQYNNVNVVEPMFWPASFSLKLYCCGILHSYIPQQE